MSSTGPSKPARAPPGSGDGAPMRRAGLSLLAVLGALALVAPVGARPGHLLEAAATAGGQRCLAARPGRPPVVLVHGTLASRREFFVTSPRLEAAGFCTFSLNYGGCTNQGSFGRGPIEDSVAEVRRFIDEHVLPPATAGRCDRWALAGRLHAAALPQVPRRARKGSEPRQLLGLGPRTNNPLAPSDRGAAASRARSSTRMATS